MLVVEQYPMVLRSDGPRGRPRDVQPLASGSWRVDWIDGVVSMYRRDPREHLRLGYEPKHLRQLLEG
jgi:hypothetical protein